MKRQITMSETKLRIWLSRAFYLGKNDVSEWIFREDLNKWLEKLK